MKQLTPMGQVMNLIQENVKVKSYFTSVTVTRVVEAFGWDRKYAKRLLDLMVSDGMMTKSKPSRQPFTPYFYTPTEKANAIYQMAAEAG